MNIIEAVKSGFINYANFSDRACRSEYWYWKLFFLVLGIIEVTLYAISNNAISTMAVVSFISIQALVLFIPGLSIIVRRLHDTDRQGWWILILLVPFVGIITFLVFVCLKGTNGRNRFGDNPLAEKDTPPSPMSRPASVHPQHIPAPNTRNDDKTLW